MNWELQMLKAAQSLQEEVCWPVCQFNFNFQEDTLRLLSNRHRLPTSNALQNTLRVYGNVLSKTFS